MWIFLVGLMVYVIAPIVTVASLKKIWNHSTSPLTTLVGISVGPFLVALMQYFLLAVLPEKNPLVYPILIGVVFLLFGVWSRKYLLLPKKIIWKRPVFNVASLFVGVVVMFTFIRMVMYPPTWGDIYEYIQQAYVYSQDRGLWRTNSGVPFTADSTHYVINPAIRPGIPMLDSLFFLVAAPTPTVLILTHFVYSYYFVLLLFTVGYGGKLLGFRGSNLLWSVVLTLSSFYVVRFAIYGAKEIILMELAILSLYALYELGKSKKIDWKYLILMGVTMGIGSFINFSGTIVAAIIGLIFLFWVRYPLKIRIWTAVVLAGLVILFGGLEPWNGAVGFIFSPTPLSSKTVVVDAAKSKQAELRNYGLATSREVILKGKLQGFTQPQFFGLIFSAWFVITIISWMRGDKWSRLEKLLLSYVLIYFLVIMDPLSINPHKYAYILSISPKYTLMLVPILSILLVGRIETIRSILRRIPKQTVYFVGGFGLLLIPMVRQFLTAKMLEGIENTMSLTQNVEYYILLINNLMIAVGIASLLVVLSAKYWQNHYGKLAVMGLFMIPTLFLINTNFGIIPTLRNMFESIPTKMIKGEIDLDNRNAFTLAKYINENLAKEAQIIFLFRDNRIGFFINNRERLYMPYNAFNLTAIERMVRDAEIPVEYFVYTSRESQNLILETKLTRQIASVGPYIIREVIK